MTRTARALTPPTVASAPAETMLPIPATWSRRVHARALDRWGPTLGCSRSGGVAAAIALRREIDAAMSARERERVAMLRRVQHRRAQADAAMAAHHERVCGRPPRGRPDFEAPLEVSAGGREAPAGSRRQAF